MGPIDLRSRNGRTLTLPDPASRRRVASAAALRDPRGDAEHTPPPVDPQRTPPLLPRRSPLACAVLLALVAVALPLAACKTSWELESRETPVHVTLVAPAAAQAPQRAHVLVYVGDRKAVDGPVAFPQGTTRLELPTVYVRSGSPTVSVILDGRAVASSNVTVKQTTFVVVTLTASGATIASADQDPTAAR